jgi:uncharacterized protein YlxW (UPF0749 family)
MFDSRDIVMRSELAAMRVTVEELQAEVRELRAQVKVLPAEMHSSTMRMVSTLGAKLSDALPVAVASAAERHLLRRAIDGAVPATEAAS